MKTGRKARLEARLASRGVSSTAGAIKRHVSPWPLYAAVTGSALAMSPAPGVQGDFPSIAAIHRLTGSPNSHLVRAANLALAARTAEPNLEDQTPAAAQAVQGKPVVNPGGIVPVYSTSNTIQPGEWVSIYGTTLASGTTVWSGISPRLSAEPA